MNRYYLLTIIMILSASGVLKAQPWVQNNSIFNPSGVPSLPFSQPRFADLDADGDVDLIIGSINENPFYVENIGTSSNPQFAPGTDIFSNIGELDAEVAVFHDLDNDGDLDMISGGFSGLNLFDNTGNQNNPEFTHIAGFFAGLNDGQNPIPDLADLDADGDLDMVVGFSESGEVKIYENTGTSEVAEFSESQMYVVGDVGLYAYPTFADLDNDDDFDLIVGRDGLGFWYFENVGTPESASWQNESGIFTGIGNLAYFNSPGFADLNGDNTFDMVFGNADGPLNCYYNTGTPENPAWEENTSLFGGVLDPGGASNPFVFDYDGDGDLDMFSGSQMGDIIYYQNVGTVTGPAWQENSAPFTSLKHSIYSAVTVGDVNDDGLIDAIVGDLSGNLFFHKNIGFDFEFIADEFLDFSFGGWSSPRLIDMDNDNDLDIIVGNENGNLNYIENQGSPQTPEWVLISGYFGSIDVGSNCVPAIADLDYDGDYDVLCGNLFGDIIWLENQDGNWIENNTMVIGINGEQNASPALGDFDGDGDMDLVLGEYSGVFSYFRNDFMFVNISNTNNSNVSLKAYPNPCNENICIQYSLKQQQKVNLQILNSSGQIVHQEDMDNQKAGINNYYFNTNMLKSGVYFVKIKSANNCEVKRIIKL